MEFPVLGLDCAVVHNVWGKKGSDSLVARLKTSAEKGFSPSPDKPYAQLWLGDHPNQDTYVKVPSATKTANEKVPLRQWVREHPEQLGSTARSPNELSFLLKVLSIHSPLALQTHPSKTVSEQLSQTDPDNFDSNHKPEMAVALSSFSTLLGFRPVREIVRFLQDIDEFRSALGPEISNQFQLAALAEERGDNSAKQLTTEALRAAFLRLVNPSSDVRNALTSLLEKVKEDPQRIPDLESEVLRFIAAEYPGDQGAMTVFLLNVVRCEPGEAAFIDVMVPHAYLMGDVMEIQANSDNVFRAAFTHKRRDIELMAQEMNYSTRSASEVKVHPKVEISENLTSALYAVPCPDFSMTRYQIHTGTSSASLPAIDSSSILVVLEGYGKMTWQLQSHQLFQNGQKIGSNDMQLSTTDGRNSNDGVDRGCEQINHKERGNPTSRDRQNKVSAKAPRSIGVNGIGAVEWLELNKGTAMFVAADTSLEVKNESQTDLVIFRAHSGLPRSKVCQ